MEEPCPMILAPETLACSGRGACFAGQCICEAGYSAVADFSFDQACSTNTTAVRALWSLLACVHFLVLPYTVSFLRKKMQVSAQKHSHAAIGVGYGLLINNICMIFCGILRAVDVETRAVGRDVLLTTIFCIGSAAFWAAGFVCVAAFLLLSSMQASKGFAKDGLLVMHKNIRTQLPPALLLGVLACMMPFGMLTATSQWGVYSYGVAHYFILAGAMVYIALYRIPRLIQPLEADIRSVIQSFSGSSSSAPSLKSGNSSVIIYEMVLKKLTTYRSEFAKQAIFNVIFAVLFGAWPFLQARGTSYFLPFAWTSAAVVGLTNMRVLLPVSSGKGEKGNTVQGSSADSNHSSVRGGPGVSSPSVKSLMKDMSSKSALVSPPAL